jgi:hypothetical protein
VDNGWVTLQVPLIKVHFHDNDDAGEMLDRSVFHLAVDEGKRIKYNVRVDFEIDVATFQELPLYFTLFGRDTLNDPTILYPSLLLTPTGEDSDQYRRLGMVLVRGLS